MGEPQTDMPRIYLPTQETAAQVKAWRAKSAKDLGELDEALQQLTEVRCSLAMYLCAWRWRCIHVGSFVHGACQERTKALEELALLRERRREELAQEAAEKVRGWVWSPMHGESRDQHHCDLRTHGTRRRSACGRSRSARPSWRRGCGGEPR